ncbi:jg6546 [Pararge aegeria aegeria]|uniref:Jg6546 protein n=1 Tax=Pararge aegeria aegeria TaxID=348720 RepID=A0A8S4S3C5_9NEOP|nr:jg6546 [Pararge aegeria aegeria]
MFQTVRENSILADNDNSNYDQFKYVQVLDSDKNVVVDLLNLTLVKCDDGQESYRLVSNDDTESGGEETVTCVLSNDDGEEHDPDSYVVMEGSDGPLVFLQSSLPQPEPEKPKEQAALTPLEILERAKSLQKAKALMSLHTPTTNRGRRRKTQLPPPHELLASPHFKLYLYSCKLCNFKCNAIKELTAHKAAEHAGGGGKWRAGVRASSITLQCARCPFRGNNHSQLLKHVKDRHFEVTTVSTSKGLLDSAEVHEADVLVCGACGFESSERHEFKLHIEEKHGVTAC